MKKFIILIPLFNDWKSVSKLLEKIDFQINNWKARVSVLIVNDSSTEKRSNFDLICKKIESIKILNMKKNRGHQRCIAAGLKYICEKEEFDRVIVMDADGEDRPEELVVFFNKSEENPEKTVTGNRFKRSEGFIFKFLYEMHKLLTLIFTGKLIKFGNFTCLPKNHVKELIQKPYLWNSYSSSVVKSIKERISILSTRGFRYVEPSKMNFFSLVFHSLTIISVFRNLVLVRSIVFFLVYLFLIYNKISILSLVPVFGLLFFVIIILKISLRSNLDGLDRSLDNIVSVDILENFDNRQ